MSKDFIKLGTIIELTKRQSSDRPFHTIPIGTKCVVIKKEDMPAYDLLVGFEDEIIQNITELQEGWNLKYKKELNTMYVERGTWKVADSKFKEEPQECENDKKFDFEDLITVKSGYNPVTFFCDGCHRKLEEEYAPQPPKIEPITWHSGLSDFATCSQINGIVYKINELVKAINLFNQKNI